jgi:hypothetical protein
MLAGDAGLGLVIVHGVTRMTEEPHPLARLADDALLFAHLPVAAFFGVRLDVARVAVGVFVEFGAAENN